MTPDLAYSPKAMINEGESPNYAKRILDFPADSFFWPSFARVRVAVAMSFTMRDPPTACFSAEVVVEDELVVGVLDGLQGRLASPLDVLDSFPDVPPKYFVPVFVSAIDVGYRVPGPVDIGHRLVLLEALVQSSEFVADYYHADGTTVDHGPLLDEGLGG
ncbi:MAG: hypothetical protein IKQ60_01585 [Candidatus Methanomethylophilaceae archaeon]|nr:hypothetical protein [Candidatus Methanomethylophilaceae archaeon]